MTNNISSEQAVINQVMASLPEVKSKKVHTLQKGESLWGLARKELGKEKLSNREIRDYMLLIAKINNLTTVEKMNGLKANQKIYLPEEIAENSVVKNMSAKERSDLEKTIESVIHILQTDESVHVKKAAPEFMNLYHIFRTKRYPSGFVSSESPVLSFKMDKKEKIQNITMDDNKNFNPLQQDYEIDKNGKVKINGYPPKPFKSLSNEDKQTLFNEVYKQYEEYKQDPQVFY